MAIINQSNILNLQPGITAPVVVHMSEGDVGTNLSFKLIDGARAWTDPGNVVAAVHGRRQDGTQFGPYACTISGDVVTFQTDAAIAAVAGSGIAQIVLTDSDQNTAGTANFAIMVERATFPMGVTYTNDVSVYEAILAYVQALPAKINGDFMAKLSAETIARETTDAEIQRQLSETTSNIKNTLSEEITARAQQDEMLSARMDEFTKLPDGSLSTAGDAELADIRVKADGTTAATAGDAVRTQITTVKNVIDDFVMYDLDKIQKKKTIVLEQGSLNTNTGAEGASLDYSRSQFIPVVAGNALKLSVSNIGVNASVVIHALYYDANRNFISPAVHVTAGNYVAYGETKVYTVTPPGNAVYVRLRAGSSPSGTTVTYTMVRLYFLDITPEAVLAYMSDVTPLQQNALLSMGNVLEAGLDLNEGVFRKPGMWFVNDLENLPKHSPTAKRCRIIVFASRTDNSLGTLQAIVDADGMMYWRYSNANDVFDKWRHVGVYHSNAFSCLFTDPEPFRCDYDINRLPSGETDRVNKLYALYDDVTQNGVTITKDTLGNDATGTFLIYNYKVSWNIGEKPVVLIVCGEHGNELTSAYLGYMLYKEIVQGALQKYLRYVDFWVIPLMNPYGYQNGTRNNGNDVNLNRDFPAMWEYSTTAHNKTGDYSLSQPETQIIYNLLVNNRDKILFACNKHDTGSLAGKVSSDQPDIAAYVSTLMKQDYVVNNGIAAWENEQVRETAPWIIDDCTQDISTKTLIPSRTLPTPGSMDVFFNSIGIHGSLLEVAGAAYYTGEAQLYPVGQFRYKELARLGLDFFVNYIATTIEHNSEILTDDELLSDIKYYTRKEIEGVWTTVEQYWNGAELKDI